MQENCYEFSTVDQLMRFLLDFPKDTLIRGSSIPTLKIRVIEEKDENYDEKEKVIVFDDVSGCDDSDIYDEIIGSECYADYGISSH